MLLPTMPTFLLLFLLLSAADSSDLSTDRSALLALRSALSGKTTSWNAAASTPCNWTGVHCDNNRVSVLRLPASSLAGGIPETTLANLTSLRTLSLRLNRLSGPLPRDISRLSQLRNLYLQGNRFTGPFPESLFSLHSLVRLNLASNDFSGEIPPGLGNLTRLRTLYLEQNRFSGSLPDIDLPNLDQFNVSSNNLNGSVPKGLSGKPRDAFLNTFLCGQPLDTVCDDDAGPPAENRTKNSGKNKLSGSKIAGIVIGSVVGLFLLVLISFAAVREIRGRNPSEAATSTLVNQAHSEPEITEESSAFIDSSPTVTEPEIEPDPAAAGEELVFLGNASRVFTLAELLSSKAENLEKGSFWNTYKVDLPIGMEVVVKRLMNVTVNEREFREIIEEVGGMNHENLFTPLKAYFYGKEEKFLVFDHVPMKRLSTLLHGDGNVNKTPLNWETRFSIARGTALGIEYLHIQGHDISHGDIMSFNILLTESNEVKLSDFCLKPLVVPTVRNDGYRAPEVTNPRRLSQRADVYSFGILLFELLTGKAPYEEGFDLARWVHTSVCEEVMLSVIFDVELVTNREMVEVLKLGIHCTEKNPDNRPSIMTVVGRLEEIRRSGLARRAEESG